MRLEHTQKKHVYAALLNKSTLLKYCPSTTSWTCFPFSANDTTQQDDITQTKCFRYGYQIKTNTTAQNCNDSALIELLQL